MNSTKVGKAAAVLTFAAVCWMVPLGWTLQRHRVAGWATPEPAGKGADSRARTKARPLILYVEAWPTRAKLDLREIQGLTTESESSLAPAQVADNLVSALGRLGITPEIHRLDRLPAGIDLEKFRPVVMIYPARHGRPTAEVAAFFDRQVEPLVARRAGRVGLAFADIAVAETPEVAAAAQQSLREVAMYYGAHYAGGPRLDPRLSRHRERQILAEFASDVRAEAER